MNVRAVAMIALGVVAVGWAAVVVWLTVADSRHREFYAGPGVSYQVRDTGMAPGISMPPGSYFGVAVSGVHTTTVVVLVVAGAGLIAAGLKCHSVSARGVSYRTADT